jgi:hypothetical protein
MAVVLVLVVGLETVGNMEEEGKEEVVGNAVDIAAVGNDDGNDDDAVLLFPVSLFI